MIPELEQVVLLKDLSEFGLVAGDVGTVVMVYDGGRGYSVEFTTLRGDTVAVATVASAVIRPVMKGEMVHARAVA